MIIIKKKFIKEKSKKIKTKKGFIKYNILFSLCLIIISIFFLSQFKFTAAQTLNSYNKFSECNVEGVSCNDFLLNTEDNTLSFSFRSDKYQYEYKQNIGVTSIRIMNSNSYNYDPYGMYDDIDINNKEYFSCRKVIFGKDPQNLNNEKINFGPNDVIYVYASDCDFPKDNWFNANIRVDHTFNNKIPEHDYGYNREVNDGFYTQEQTGYYYGNIKKFIETPGYIEREKMNRYFFRWIPFVIIILISLLGLIRIKR